MNKTVPLHPALVADLEKQGADINRTLQILSLLADTEHQIEAQSSVKLPKEGDPRITDLESLQGLEMDAATTETFFTRYSIPQKILDKIQQQGTRLYFSREVLYILGIYLFPYTAYGVLNGGSATTYGDIKKNQALSPAAFELFKEDFLVQAEQCKNSPKGITSAYFEADGTGGPSFLLLKMRSLLIHALEYRLLTGDYSKPVLPFFQMTSDSTDAKLREAYKEYRHDPLLRDLIAETRTDPTEVLSEKQGLIGALTHSSEGLPRKIFDRAYGLPNRGLALPGGHGENFRVLAPVYRKLHSQGIRFVYLGNVDNSGYTIDPIALAYFALKSHSEAAEAGFEFSWRTPVDVKGGLLVEEASGHLTVGEIGQRISGDTVRMEEAKGAHVLFNCATGLFSLDYLINKLDSIPNMLPIRLSDQDKEAGRYAQAEQTTWEVLGLMKKPQIFAVSKQRRFLAAKMLMETYLASPQSTKIDKEPRVEAPIQETSRILRTGLQDILRNEYGFSLEAGSYKARSMDSLKEEIRQRIR